MSKMQMALLTEFRDDCDEVPRLDKAIIGDVRQSYMKALQGIALTTWGLSVLVTFCSLFMRQNKLHTNHGRQ